MVNRELQHEIEQFLYREARLLSEGRYEEWLELFTDDARYWMPVRETRERREDAVSREGELAIFEDDKAFLTARVQRMRSKLAHAEQPPSRTRYFISNVEVEEQDETHLQTACNLLVYQSRLEKTASTYVGARRDRMRKVDGTWRIAERKIVLDQTLIPRTISIFF